MRRLLCVAALAVTDAAAKFALEKKGQKVFARCSSASSRPRRRTWP